MLKVLPTGFRCRDGILVGRSIPPTKYIPENAIYIYKLQEGRYGLEPVEPVVADKIPYGKYLMTLSRGGERRMRALTLLQYNGNKNNGEVLFLPLNSPEYSIFEVKQCRLIMTDKAKIINSLTVIRR